MSVAGRCLLGAVLLAGCSDQLVPRGPVPAPPGPADRIASVILIGDGGKPHKGGEPVLTALEAELAAGPESTTVVFLGDNVYFRGVPPETSRRRPEAERRLFDQVDAALTGPGPVIFVPGNHDWDKSGPHGWGAIRRQGELIAARGAGRARLLPADGCPGPAVVDMGERFRLVLLDTEWWLHPGPKPDSTGTCEAATVATVTARLAAAIAEAGPRRVIVAAHHPLQTGGEHGGYFGPGEHVFPLRELDSRLWIPLPLIGSIYPIARSMGISDEDMAGGRNRYMRGELERVFRCAPPLIYAAGHEHGLQVIDRGSGPLLLVSGAGILGHEGFIQGTPGAAVALSRAGFMRVDMLRDGRTVLTVLTVDRTGRATPAYVAAVAPPERRGNESCRDST